MAVVICSSPALLLVKPPCAPPDQPFCAVLMVGLGCETFQIARWKQAYNIAESDTFRSLTIQDSGGTQKAVTGRRSNLTVRKLRCRS